MGMGFLGTLGRGALALGTGGASEISGVGNTVFGGQSEGEEARSKSMSDAARAYTLYRPAMADARTKSFHNQMGAYSGPLAMLQQKYGTGPNMAQLMQPTYQGVPGMTTQSLDNYTLLGLQRHDDE